MRVLFAIDGSVHSLEAVGQIGLLLTPGRDEVAFYCSPPEFHLQANNISSDVIAHARQGLADSIFNEARTRLPTLLQDRVHRIVGTRDPRSGIVAAAEQWPADLMVVGARGLGRFDRLLLGSVSRAVVHAAKIPVWVARSKPPVPHEKRRILVACENPETGRPAVDLLARFSWPPKSTACALTVIASQFGGRVPDWLLEQARSPEAEHAVQLWIKEHDAELRVNSARLSELIKSLPFGFPTCQPLVAEGDPAGEILKAAAEQQADLIVVGVHRQGFLSSLVPGSTSEAVLNHAECSVLTVPHRELP